MLTVALVLSWGLALKVTLVLALVVLVYSAYATVHVALDFWHERRHYQTDWRWVCDTFRAPFRPLAWLVARVFHVRAGSPLGRALLGAYKALRGGR